MLHPQTSAPPEMTTTNPVEGVAFRYPRPPRVNHEKNQELQLKVDDLEKLFAAHRRRISGEEQVSSGTRSQLADVQSSPARKALEEMPAERFESSEKRVMEDGRSNLVEFNAADSLLKMVDNLEYNMKQSQSESSRGRLYERYTTKRGSKLREQWRLKGVQRRLDFEKMEETFALTWTQMTAQFGAFDDTQEEMPALANSQPRYRDQETGESFRNVEVLGDQIPYDEDKSSGETLHSDGSSKSISGKLLSSNYVPSTSPQTSVSSSPSNPTNSSRTKQKAVSRNTIAQSLPNSSDSRKENKQPTTGTDKVNTHSQCKTYVRSKSNGESTSDFKEEKLLMSEHIRKSSVSFDELKNLLSVDSDTPSKPSEFSKEKSEKNVPNKINRIAETKPFLRRGSGTGPGVGASVSKMRSSRTPDVHIRKESEDLENQLLYSHDLDKLEDQDLERRTKVTGRFSDLHSESDREPKSSQESDRYGNVESENDDIVGSLAQVESRSAALVSEFSATLEYKERPPEEGPILRNLTTYPLLSLQDEKHLPDIDEPVNRGNPAAWSFHPLNKMREADAARVRKKWGAAQKPVLATHAPDPTLKNVVKGFKRMLTFGRKSRGAESSVNDSVSSTPSESYSTTEDGHFLAKKPPDDLKLRNDKINPWTAPFLLLPQTSD